MIRELPPEQLRKEFDSDSLPIEATESLKPPDGIIGQERAVHALQFGLGIQNSGYNIFVAGERGIGKMTAVEAFLHEVAHSRPIPSDWCYVQNFDDSYQPIAIQLPTGKGREFQRDLKRFRDFLRREIPRLFESEEFTAKREEILRTLNAEREDILKKFGAHASAEGFSVSATPMGIVVLPAKDGKPMAEAEWNALPAKEKNERLARRETLQEELKVALKETRETERDTAELLRSLDRQAVIYLIAGMIDEFREKYHDHDEVWSFLHGVQTNLLENLHAFRSEDGSGAKLQDMILDNYLANLLVDNHRLKGAPVVVELHPTYTNLFGRVEKEVDDGSMYTDFTLIRAGALHRANGGYLVLPVEDLLRNMMSWESLKRALKTKTIKIEEPAESMGLSVPKTLRPEPIPLDVKIVLVGRPMYYYLMHELDDDFPELFKVKADFDTRMDRTEPNTAAFLAFLSALCSKEKLRHLEAGAAGKMLEHACRLAEDRDKLSTHFGALADVIREANYWAGREDAPQIRDRHVQQALEEKVYRSNLYQQRLQEYIARDVIRIDTDASVAGQVNGLAVLRLGEYEFGRPNRITASVAPGNEGIIDIERQVALGGPIHSKGVMILSGYLARTFAVGKPLTLSARLVFEQSYEGVDGDSASSTELYAILSALSDLPILQGIAVTGSVNQRGEVQAIGGVNEKIEGFFDVCLARGLTGKQGVVIPASNVNHLMLREDVVEAVRERRFHVWAVHRIEEGIELLTGRKAGRRQKNGKFEGGTVYALAEKRLNEFAASLKKLSKPAFGVKRPRKKRKRTARR